VSFADVRHLIGPGLIWWSPNTRASAKAGALSVIARHPYLANTRAITQAAGREQDAAHA
jgi:hypothetical protein